MVDFESVKGDIDLLRSDINKIKDTQAMYIEEHHDLEKVVIELKTDVRYILKGQDAMNANFTRFMFIIVAILASAIGGFIIKGGLFV